VSVGNKILLVNDAPPSSYLSKRETVIKSSFFLPGYLSVFSRTASPAELDRTAVQMDRVGFFFLVNIIVILFEASLPRSLRSNHCPFEVSMLDAESRLLFGEK